MRWLFLSSASKSNRNVEILVLCGGRIALVAKLFMADWQVSTYGIRFFPKATLPLSTQIAAYLMVLFLTGLHSKILLMAMSQLKSPELHWSMIKTSAEPKIKAHVV